MALFKDTEITTLGLAELRSPLDDPATPLNSPAIWQWAYGGQPTASGETVNANTALTISGVYACVRVISESIASLPLKLYELLNNGKQEATDAPLYYLLTVEPNPEQTAFTFWENFSGSLALTGNAYAQIERNPAGQAIALWPLHPLKTKAIRVNNRLMYETTDGMSGGQARRIAAADILHCPLFSFNGITGLSPVDLAAQSFGLTKAAEKFGARFFGNGTRPGGVMSTKTTNINDKAKQELIESWQSTQGGTNQGKTAFLFGDWTYQQIGLSPEQSQFLATRQFQRTEVAAWFRIPPHMIGDTSRLSNANHEQESLQFVTDTLRPYLARIENEIVRKLLPTQGRKANKYVVAFDVTERLRGDFKNTQDGFATGRQWGWLSGNDVRRELGMNPGGPELNCYLVPVNMINAKALPDKVSTAPEPEPEPTAPTPAERNALGGLTTAYVRLFRDSVGRITGRSKRDLDAISACFRPVLTSITEEIERQAANSFGLNDGWNAAQERIIKDALKALEKRSSEWMPEHADDIAGQELTRTVRALLVAVHREAGAASALKGLDDE